METSKVTETEVLKDFNIICDTLDFVIVKKNSGKMSAVYEEVLESLTEKYKELRKQAYFHSLKDVRNPYSVLKDKGWVSSHF